MNIAQIESNIQKLLVTISEESFIYDFLLAYDTPKATIKRLRDGALNLSKHNGQILWKKKLLFQHVLESDLHLVIDELKSDSKVAGHAPRFIIVTDFHSFLAIDTKTKDSLDIKLASLVKHFDFFLPFAGMEKADRQSENPADVKAAEKMAKLYDEIKKDNPTENAEQVHSLNVFLSRLLFCFFAEDTGIFELGQFTKGISSHTQQDGNDLNTYLDRLFNVMNMETGKRESLPAYLDAFPYVNGGLFRNSHQAPIFTIRSRQAIIESGELDWSAINPDIFGSMIQAVITPEHRGGLGMHYTSVPNIMKVIEPLFLTELYEEFIAANRNTKRLKTLLQRIWNIKIFDPACGSGNFLIIAYKELRRLEMKIFKQLGEMGFSQISLSHFYGIELDDFAHEVAILSLWLAEHQMNQEFFKEFGRAKPALPLMETGNIIHDNATRFDWETACPKTEGDEIYILGNPPYLGYSMQSKGQKEDMAIVFKDIDGYKNLDYIACWFFLGARYIANFNSKFAFVSTNSICQGEQVSSLWPHVLNKKLEIGFAHTSFKWANNAKGKAAVICIIVGVRNIGNITKYLFAGKFKNKVLKINPYLVEGGNVFIQKRNRPLSKIQPIIRGTGFSDDGKLNLTSKEKDDVLSIEPEAAKLIKKVIGSYELINNHDRWCFWVTDKDWETGKNISELGSRVALVKAFRLESKKSTTQLSAQYSYKASENRFDASNSLVIPRVSSERREYIPIDFVNGDTVIIDSAQAIYNPETWIFAVVTSLMHMVWVRAIAGRLKTDYRYSSALCYNTFPFPNINQIQKQELEKHVYKILEEREHHSEKTLAQLYDPDKMPAVLREAHHQLDLAIERCYRSKPFESDEERLEYLFKLYEQMIAEEKAPLFKSSNPKTKKK